jgi:hypothetical protein
VVSRTDQYACSPLGRAHSKWELLSQLIFTQALSERFPYTVSLPIHALHLVYHKKVTGVVVLASCPCRSGKIRAVSLRQDPCRSPQTRICRHLQPATILPPLHLAVATCFIFTLQQSLSHLASGICLYMPFHSEL